MLTDPFVSHVNITAQVLRFTSIQILPVNVCLDSLEIVFLFTIVMLRHFFFARTTEVYHSLDISLGIRDLAILKDYKDRNYYEFHWSQTDIR